MTIVKFLHFRLQYIIESLRIFICLMDTFGFDNQGKNYGKFRPKYPESFYVQTVNSLDSKDKYLDIAMGTGQLLFNIALFFKSSKGTDISDNMLEAAKTELSTQLSHLREKIKIQKCNILELPQKQKFDLVTIGQALHWLPIQGALEKIKNILQPSGKLLIISYIVKGLQDENQNKYYQQFYELTKETKPDFCFNRDELHYHYKDKKQYPFEEYFKNVSFQSEDVKVSMPKEAYIRYMKTYAGYNLMMAKNAFTEDPIKSVQQNTRGDTVTIIIDYFKVECFN